MAKPTTPTERRVLAIIDRHTIARETLTASLVRAILRILARLFAAEQAALDLPATRGLGAQPAHSQTGRPALPPAPSGRDSTSASSGEPAAPAPRPKSEVYTPERMEARRQAAREIAVLVRRAETKAANLVRAQNDAIARELGQRPAAKLSGYVGARPRRVEPETEWLRPVYDFLEAAREGRGVDEAARLAAERVDVQVSDDINVATREGNASWMEDNLGMVTGYRRVLHPELSEGGSCGLCVAAATRVYYVDRLHPLHARCKCGVVPIFNDDWGDIGAALNERDITDLTARLYADAGGSNRREDLTKTRYKVVEHDELGPQFEPYRAPSSRQKSAADLAERGSMKDNPNARRGNGPAPQRNRREDAARRSERRREARRRRRS